MPKIKTHKGAKKRFKVTATGKVKAKSAARRHLLAKKGRQNKREKGNSNYLTPIEGKMVRRLLGLGA
jgi:large subunit ribosomal protein L35